MTPAEAELIINYILDLRQQGTIDDDKIVEALTKKFSGSKESFYWVLEMMSTGALRAALISNGTGYPKTNINIEDNIILKTAFKMKWIELKGLQHFEEHYKKEGNSAGLFNKNINIYPVINHSSDIFKIIYGYLLLILFAILPVLISIVGVYIGKLFGYELNESNSIIGSIGWFSFITIPLSLIATVAWTVLSIKNLFNFYKKK